jgi:asparagine synthase (glutamine-hydrolysing)
MFLVAKEARRSVTVVLTGDGGDEMFGGYDRFRGLLLSRKIPAAAQKPLTWITRAVPRRDAYGALRGRLDRFSSALASGPAGRYASWVMPFDQTALRSVLLDKPDEDVRSSFYRAWTEADAQPLLHRALHANLRTYLHDDLLVKTDRMTMAHGLEARSPFLDVPLLEKVASLPPQMKATAWESKRVLRRAIGGMVPAEVLKRPKHGFGVPVGAWFRSELREPFADLVLSGSARCATVIDTDAVGGMFQEHVAKRADHGQRLWALLALESWLRGREGSGH